MAGKPFNSPRAVTQPGLKNDSVPRWCFEQTATNGVAGLATIQISRLSYCIDWGWGILGAGIWD